MEVNIRKSLLTVCTLLEKHNVKYMIIGGTAVALNGYYRHSTDIDGKISNKPDIDIWYNPSYENYFNILKVIEGLGHEISEFKKEKSPNPHKAFFKLESEEFTLDMLPKTKVPTKFLDAYNRKETVDLDETPIHFMSYFDLLEDKLATSRKKDLEDIVQLKKNKNEE